MVLPFLYTPGWDLQTGSGCIHRFHAATTNRRVRALIFPMTELSTPVTRIGGWILPRGLWSRISPSIIWADPVQIRWILFICTSTVIISRGILLVIVIHSIRVSSTGYHIRHWCQSVECPLLGSLLESINLHV